MIDFAGQMVYVGRAQFVTRSIDSAVITSQ